MGTAGRAARAAGRATAGRGIEGGGAVPRRRRRLASRRRRTPTRRTSLTKAQPTRSAPPAPLAPPSAPPAPPFPPPRPRRLRPKGVVAAPPPCAAPRAISAARGCAWLAARTAGWRVGECVRERLMCAKSLYSENGRDAPDSHAEVGQLDVQRRLPRHEHLRTPPRQCVCVKDALKDQPPARPSCARARAPQERGSGARRRKAAGGRGGGGAGGRERGFRAHVVGRGTRRVRLVRGEGRGVST